MVISELANRGNLSTLKANIRGNVDFIDRERYKDKSGIYGIRNKENDFIYVGQTHQRFLKRYLHHAWKLAHHIHDNVNLQADWDKYGADSFEFIVIEEVADRSQLDELEIKYIDYYKQQGVSYNILLGGPGRSGIPLSDSAKQKIGEENRQHMLGRHASEETKQKMSASRKGRYIPRSTDVLTPDIAKDIKQRLISGEKPSDIAHALGIDYRYVNNILSNNAWSTISVEGWDEFRANRRVNHRLTPVQHDEIRRMYFEEGYSRQELADQFNKTKSCINKILRT